MLSTEMATYGTRSNRALPGVWIPKWNRLWRGAMLFSILSAIFLLYAQGLSYFLPWDAPGVKGHIANSFIDNSYSSETNMHLVRILSPNADWSSLPPHSEFHALGSRIRELDNSIAGMEHQSKIAAIEQMANLQAERLHQRRAIASTLHTALIDSPSLWAVISLQGILAGDLFLAGYFVLALVLGTVLPVFTILAAWQKPLIEVLQLRQHLEEVAEDGRTTWECYVDRLRQSKHVVEFSESGSKHESIAIREADHLFLGIDAWNGFPVLLHRNLLSQHAFITGGSGSGKTTLGVMSLLIQLIKGDIQAPSSPDPQDGADLSGLMVPPTAPAGSYEPMPPIVIIDLKGDYALLHTTIAEARQRARYEGREFSDTFRLFSCERGKATHRFNPMAELGIENRSLVDFTNLLVEAFELNHGAGYGRSFFTKQNFMQLHRVLADASIENFDQLYRALEANFTQRDRNQALELLATVYALKDYDQLVTQGTADSQNSISMSDVVQRRQVAYFWLPVVETSLTARIIANLAIFSLYSAMNSRQQRRMSKIQTYLFIDEFQNVVGEQFCRILEQSRSFGLSAILSNQSVSQLRRAGFDLRNDVLENTQLKLYFSIADQREMAEFSRSSGLEMSYERSGTYASDPDEEPDHPLYENWRHVIKPRVDMNDILRVTDHPMQAFMQVRQGSGYTQFGGAPVPVQMFYPIPRETFTERDQHVPWPTPDELGIKDVIVSEESTVDVDSRIACNVSDIEKSIEDLFNAHPDLRKS